MPWWVKYTAKRLGELVFVLAGILAITFLLTRVVPSDPARMAAGPRATPEQVAQLRESMGLNDGLFTQFARYLGGLARGDFGTSFITQRPVIDDLGSYFPATFELVLWAVGLMAVLGIGLGMIDALSPSRITSALLRVASYGAVAIPVFLSALLALIVFYGVLGWAPPGGRFTGQPPTHVTGLYTLDAVLTGDFEGFRIAVSHLLLPSLVLGISRAGVMMRFVSSELQAALGSDYALMARAKGVGKARLISAHGLRNALLPVTTMLGMQFGWLLSGAVLVELIFGWPGLGTYMIGSISALDTNPVIMTALVLGFVFALINLLVDLLHASLDPRIARQ